MSAIKHEVDAGALTLTTTGFTPAGDEVVLTAKWTTAETMFDNIAKAKEIHARRIATLDAKITQELKAGVVDNVKKIFVSKNTTITLFTSRGGKPWILPRFKVEGKRNLGQNMRQRFAFGAGWLYGCFLIGVHKNLNP